MSICIKAQEHTRDSIPALKTQKDLQSFKEITFPFKGKIIYIDLMASWHKPCIAELQAANLLKSHFDNNYIVRFFISIDNKEAIEKAN